MVRQKFNLKSVLFEKAVVSFVILAVALLILGIFVHQKSEKASFYRPTGYIKKVQSLVDRGTIKYDRKRATITFDNRSKSKNIEDFYNQSYLKKDIDSFNDGNYFSTFNIKEGKIQLDIRARQLKLPYTVIRQWTGNLFYRNTGNSAILENDHIHLQVLPAPRKILPLRAFNYEEVPVQKEGFYSQYGFLLKHDIRKYFAQVEYIGDNVVLGVKYKPPYLSVNNYKIPVGNNIRLEDGDVIYFYDEGYKDYLLFKEKGSAGLISSTRNVNGKWERIYFSKSLPMVEHFCNGLQSIVSAQVSEENEKEENFDIILTLDRKLHHIVQKELVKFIKGKDGKKNLKYYPAAVTLMDIDSGDILALGSFPDPPSMPALSWKLRRRNDSYKRRLNLNQNLLNHPIGSAVKPMLASAIWAVHPKLSNFRIVEHPGGNESNSTLGLSFAKPFEIFGHPVNVIDRRAFLKYSCNLYMVNLFLLGLASDHNKSLNFTFKRIPGISAVGNTMISFGVDFSDYLKRGSNTFVNLQRSPIVHALRDIFAIETEVVDSNDIRENTAAKYDTQLLELINKKLMLQNKFDLKPLYSSCPEQVNLKFNQIQLLRSEFISLDFGGASSEWNNIKLAESISRVVTGKKVNARLIMEVLDKKTSNSLSDFNRKFESFDQKIDTALQWVREGMRLVATKGGTAKELASYIEEINRNLIRKNLRITVYSKTGSPRKLDDGPNSAVYIFSIILEKKKGAFWKTINGISGTIYIENRGKSTLAVTFAKKIFEHAVEYLKHKYQMSG